MKKYNYTTKTLNLNKNNEEERIIFEKLKDEKYPSNKIKEILYKYFKKEEQ